MKHPYTHTFHAGMHMHSHPQEHTHTHTHTHTDSLHFNCAAKATNKDSQKLFKSKNTNSLYKKVDLSVLSLTRYKLLIVFKVC